MGLIKHCIVDTNTNKVVNIIEYETLQTGAPLGFEQEQPYLLCVASEIAGIGWNYIDGQFTDNRPKDEELT